MSINHKVFGPESYKLCSSPELIENYEEAINDTAQTWDCHHRLETHNSDGEIRLVQLTKKELIALGMYYSRPPCEFIFMKQHDHLSLHRKFKRDKRDNRVALRAWKTRRMNGTYKHSVETREHLSKLMSKCSWWTNRIVSSFCEICPEGFRPGRVMKNMKKLG